MTDWKQEWREVIDAEGTDFSDGQVHYGADPVEASTIRRYLEPLEFDCALHYDAKTARQHGYADIIAPYTATMQWAMPPMWSPGDPPLFTDDSRDAQPARSPIDNQDFPLGPKTTGYFATDMEMDFVRPVTVGERLGRRGHRLVSCTPKETTVGRGAFMKWESEIVDANGEVVMRMRTGTYAYQPHPPSAHDSEDNA
ncbi:MAG TPA: MaoC family dehydratase N-terminal domain-containing protein [Streptosporangiaceae bacterium]|nr:MaoC family dehydratase N-terminal domain-containing protein [Streptosporangiaceae bacterium]